MELYLWLIILMLRHVYVGMTLQLAHILLPIFQISLKHPCRILQITVEIPTRTLMVLGALLPIGQLLTVKLLFVVIIIRNTYYEIYKFALICLPFLDSVSQTACLNPMNGYSFKGAVGTTRTNQICISWSSMISRTTNKTTDPSFQFSLLPDGSVENSANYCR